MIFGIGTDIVAVSRIDAAIARHGDRFTDRILTAQEKLDLAAHALPRFLAKRFAAKEAFSKAYGTGISAEVSWHDVMVSHDERGKPVLRFTSALQSALDARGLGPVHISISDEVDHAVAFVIIERT
jgi:holo-[acyl-carrier protein] synthase